MSRWDIKKYFELLYNQKKFISYKRRFLQIFAREFYYSASFNTIVNWERKDDYSISLLSVRFDRLLYLKKEQFYLKLTASEGSERLHRIMSTKR